MQTLRMQLLLYRYFTKFVNTSQLKLRALNITEVLFKAPKIVCQGKLDYLGQQRPFSLSYGYTHI